MEEKKTQTVCPYAKKCGGCQYQGVPYSAQLKKKQNQVQGLLKKFGNVKPVIGMKDPYFYRNKVHAVFDRDRRGNIISGIYQENTHNVVPVEKCMIEDQKADEIIGTIRGMLKSFKIRTFDEDTGYGLLRHVLIRKGFHVAICEQTEDPAAAKKRGGKAIADSDNVFLLSEFARKRGNGLLNDANHRLI